VLQAVENEEPAMPTPWKVALIGGEVTLLVAFTGVGLRIAMQPHRPELRPPPALVLPTVSAAVRPSPGRPIVAPRPTPARLEPVALSADWVARLGHDDRNLAATQWDILRSLISGVERYVRERVVPQMERGR
jgi:hypothetical protein